MILKLSISIVTGNKKGVIENRSSEQSIFFFFTSMTINIECTKEGTLGFVAGFVT